MIKTRVQERLHFILPLGGSGMRRDTFFWYSAYAARTRSVSTARVQAEARLTGVLAERDVLGEGRGALEEQRQQHGPRQDGLQPGVLAGGVAALGGDGEEVEGPPHGLLGEEVGVPRVREQAARQEAAAVVALQLRPARRKDAARSAQWQRKQGNTPQHSGARTHFWGSSLRLDCWKTHCCWSATVSSSSSAEKRPAAP